MCFETIKKMQSEYKNITYNFAVINLTLIYCAQNVRRYLVHGEILININNNGGYDVPYKFTGYHRDQESDLDYASARYLNRDGFISTDPKWYLYPHLTPYHYCAWNPIMFVDRDGKQYDQWNRLTKREKELSKKFPDMAYKINKNAQKATEMTISIFKMMNLMLLDTLIGML